MCTTLDCPDVFAAHYSNVCVAAALGCSLTVGMQHVMAGDPCISLGGLVLQHVLPRHLCHLFFQ